MVVEGTTKPPRIAVPWHCNNTSAPEAGYLRPALGLQYIQFSWPALRGGYTRGARLCFAPRVAALSVSSVACSIAPSPIAIGAVKHSSATSREATNTPRLEQLRTDALATHP
eukprot:404058-Pleurochrysis_carterae.AAC.2